MGDGNMKKFISALSTFIILFLLFAFSAEGLGSYDLSAECAVVMCVQTGEILFEKNAHKRHSMASTTKIMTSLIALEQKVPTKIVVADSDSINVEGTSMGLKSGEKITLINLVYGMLLLSGNDSANLTAKAIGGSNEGFAKLMNAKAKDIGMTETHFVTPSGLDDDEHYTTAYDMALLGCEAVKNPQFLSICSLKKASINYGNPPYERILCNHNKLLSYYDGALGIKTGFTKKSGRCLVSCAEKDGVMLVAVTLNAPSDWNDHKLMLDYGFSKIKSRKETEKVKIKVVGGDERYIYASSKDVSLCTDNFEKKIYIERFLYAPVKKGDVVGEVHYYANDKEIAVSPLIADCSSEIVILKAEKEDNKGIFQKFKNLFRRK